ncbi:MAG TPA: transcriptional regulator GcvA [Casimicrobiaceae bacterium]|nr:transcriptional regulator GcvA [Casimicrobiaceae bacterium]
MAGRLPPMQALRAFDAAARMRSITRAAESLHLTHGAISHQIKALEQDIGVRLFEPAGRGIRLTDEGERFAARVRSALSELEGAVREVTDRHNPRRLRVSVAPSFAGRWLLPRIGRFVAAHPDIDLDVRAAMALVDFQRDDDDVAVRFGGGTWPGAIAEFLFDEFYTPVCSPGLNGGRLPKAPQDLAGYTLLSSSDERWKPWFEAAGLDWPEPARGLVFNDASHMLQAAADGQGVALTRLSLLGNDIRNGVLVRPFSIVVPGAFRTYLVYPPRVAHSPKLVAFRNWLREEIATMLKDNEGADKRNTKSHTRGATSGAKRPRKRS